MSEHERIMSHWNTTITGCKRRPNCKPQVWHVAGCEFITCDPVDEEGVSPVPTVCRCALNNGDGEPTSSFLAKWERMHGR
jgi:hypothetical protein